MATYYSVCEAMAQWGIRRSKYRINSNVLTRCSQANILFPTFPLLEYDRPSVPMASLDGHITAQEAADRLEYTVQHVRRLLREGDLNGTKIGRDWIVVEGSVMDYATRRENLNLPLER